MKMKNESKTAIYFEVGDLNYISVTANNESSEEALNTENSDIVDRFKEKIADMFCVSVDEVHEISEEVYLKRVNEDIVFDA